MSHQQSSHEQKPDSELVAEVLEQTSQAFVEPNEVEQSEEVTEVSAELSIETLQKQLDEAKQQAAANLDKALRVHAEMENLKKRVQKDLEDERKYGLAKFAKELLSVLDSLELGLRAATGDSPEMKAQRGQ